MIVVENVAVAICGSHGEAEAVLRKLRDSGFRMKELSIAGRDLPEEGQVFGCYQNGDRIHYWGGRDVFWGAQWQQLSGWGLFIIPDIGPVLVAGPLVQWILAGLKNAMLFSGLSALGAGLYSMGVSLDSIMEYEAAVRENHYLVIACGAAGEVARAREILRTE